VLLAVAVGCSAILQLVSMRAGIYFSVQLNLLSTINNLVTEGTMIILFFLLYSILPAKKMPFLPVLISSIITSTLLLTGALLLTYYMSHSSIGEIYGVAASLLILLFWVYYSANVFLLGAELIMTWMTFSVEKKRRAGLLSRWL
jgi:membrane protein